MSMVELYQKDKHAASVLFTFLVVYLLAKKMDHSTMTREETRRENARALASEAGGLTEFGKKIGMENSQVSQIIGKTPSKNIGNLIARRIEVAFNLQEGALDRPTEDKPAIAATPQVEYIFATAEEVRLLTRYRTTNDRGRENIMKEAELAPVVVYPGIARNESQG